ncbi:DUF3866 family protein [Paenibacillus thalictri]|uniref:DUF3866 family protein n=1 Tax=Paenibacillus thalictri TaxID=2527873 RepID=A0A4Q9DVV0_9BACL|nr:DUF3866 family protein [Paenibacillus thalictri]TBL79828.1 DUF3866 family protein [Paenibacillus thalictri]
MIFWETAVVTDIVEETEAVQRVLVRLDKGSESEAVHYLHMQPQLRIGDRVLLNTTAGELGLGTGGVHFVHSICGAEGRYREWTEERRKEPAAGGHIVKLRYTPLQMTVLAAEETASPHHNLFDRSHTLAGMPVLIGELHSMLPIAGAWLHHNSKSSGRPARIVYVMSDGGALPIAFSEHVQRLKQLGWLAGTVTYGHAFGGDLEAVNKFTALQAAKYALQADITIVAMGPGMVGTGTEMGHTGLETGELINAVSVLQGLPVLIPRVGFTDTRLRHKGLSHHTLTALAHVALGEAAVPLPALLPQELWDLLAAQLARYGLLDRHRIILHEGPDLTAVEMCLQGYGLPVTTMGMGLRRNGPFFLAAAAAADYAWNCLRMQ